MNAVFAVPLTEIGRRLRLTLVMTALCAAAVAEARDYQKYLWETPRTTKIAPRPTEELVAELRREIDRILDAGPLAPLRLSYADTPHEAYWLYYERGRVITTLAYAYPHVSPKSQSKTVNYVRRLLADPKHAPFMPGVLGPTDGAVRALHGRAITDGRYISDYGPSPTLHVLYGLWLYADRSGDVRALRPYWPQIREFYIQRLETEPILYGSMGAHIAVARMAKQLGDSATAQRATDALARDLKEGENLDRIAERLDRTRFAHFRQPRNRGSFPGDCWMFLNCCPEILRFLADTQKTEVVRRTEQLKSCYPLWWLLQSPYFTRWTGDEGIGATPELLGMVYPIERWVVQTDAPTLAKYLRSAPVGIGDCYWIEALVHTIEAFGQTQWVKIE